MLPLSYVVEISRKASGNASHSRSSMQKVTLRVPRLKVCIPEGILLTKHDHALLTKNSRALALWVKIKQDILEGRAQRANTELAARRHGELAQTGAPAGFFKKFTLFHRFLKCCNSTTSRWISTSDPGNESYGCVRSISAIWTAK